MIITYLRSSSFNRFDWCEHLFYLEYVLGFKGQSNQKAEMGNIVHKALEILALIKKAKQEGIEKINEPRLGEFSVADYDLMDIFYRSTDNYVRTSSHQYTQKEVDTCEKWFKKALEFKNGAYNPLNLEIVAAEKSFDIPFTDEWATYDYELNGEKFTGQFSIKGNVDVISKYSGSIFELTDYKTGKRIDWGSGLPKEFKDFAKDPQLEIYYYALAHLYPDKDIIITIFYINDGGTFSIPFERKQLPKIKERIRKRFEEIKQTELPKLLSPYRSDWKCKRLCSAYKNLIGEKTQCEHIHNEIRSKGIQKATEDNMVKDFVLSEYADGGGATGLKEKDLK